MKKIRKFSINSDSDLSSHQNVANFNLSDVYQHFLKQKSIQGLTERTISDYNLHFQYLLNYLGDMPIHELNAEKLFEYTNWMLQEKHLSPMTVNVRLRTLRSFLRFAFYENFIKIPLYSKIHLLKTETDTIKPLTQMEIQLLLSKIDISSFVGFRDYVMICTLLDTMVRISELLNIKRDDVNLKDGLIFLNASITKTRKSRVVPLSSKTIKLLQKYLIETVDFENDILFLTFDGRQMIPSTWRDRLREYGELANISDKRVSPHTFRHTAALLYIVNGGDPFSLQKILGHTTMEMVRKYVQMSNEDIKKQHNAFSPLKNLKV